ncbi:MAG: hypothetical protein K2X32_14010 [Phycisphaerales bacterium]|nr:hypothetical protein [Phycisphaerales bacterium]
MTIAQSDRIDDRQDALMARDSPDGTPWPRRQRVTQWRLLAIVGSVSVVAGVVLALYHGVGVATLAIGAVLGCMYIMLAVWPVITAGVLEGKEERAARKQATYEVTRSSATTRRPGEHRS